MKCRACRERLQQSFDARGRVELPALSADCPDCAAWFAAARRLERGLRLLTPPAPPPGLAARVAGRVRADRRARLVRRGAWTAAVAAVAAALLVAVGARFLHPGPAPLPAPAPSPAPSPMAQKGGAHDEGPPADLRVAAADAREALSALTARTAGETVEKTRLLLPVVVDPSLATLDLPPPMGPPTEPFRDAGEGFSAGLEPVADHARHAAQLFVNNLPMQPSEN
jgi:hypothetical protein